MTHPNTISRRLLLSVGAAALAMPCARAAPPAPPFHPGHIPAVAFDAFAVFDPRPVWAACESVFPGQGSALSAAWRARHVAPDGESASLQNMMDRLHREPQK